MVAVQNVVVSSGSASALASAVSSVASGNSTATYNGTQVSVLSVSSGGSK